MIGLLGGIGPYATARYYEEVLTALRSRGGGCPELVIFSLNFDRFTELERRPEPGPCVDYLLTGLERLAAAGATVAAMTANSPHAHLRRLEGQAPLPLISIVDPVLRHVRARGYRRVLLLGIEATISAGFYQRRLADLNVEVRVPGSAEQEGIDRLVFDELGRGRIRRAALEPVRALVRAHSVDAAILGCTELPLLIGAGDLDVPIVDTLALHVEEIARHAVGSDAVDPGRPA